MRSPILTSILLMSLILGSCTLFSPPPSPTPSIAAAPSVTASPTPTITPTLTPTITLTPQPSATPTPLYPPQGYGPKNFPSDINPLTGLKASEPGLLDRRPLAIKVNIVPRTSTRPPWGISSADIVYDYYQNDGYTRFHVIFYGQDASQVGPIRSARFPDDELIRMYKSIFAYGSADPLVNSRLFSAEYSDRLILEGGGTSLCPPTDAEPLCRYDPNGFDFLLGGTKEIHAYVESQNVDDSRQNLDGMSFKLEKPSGGSSGETVSIHYSNDSYARWDYDPASGKYLRFQDNVYAEGQGEDFAPLLDRENNEQISADNVVVLLVPHSYFRKPPAELIEINFTGSGKGYAFRDDQAYEVQWNVPTPDSVMYLTYPDNQVFPYKPGNTWYQVMGESSTITQPDDGTWRFEFLTP